MVAFHAAAEAITAASHPEQQTTTLLLIDDEPDFLSLAKSELTDRIDGAKVYTASSTRKAHFRLSELDISCVVCDYEMPEQNGFGFLEELREHHPNLPFILFTAQGSENLASKAISAGVTDYLQKGEEGQFQILANRVTNAIEQHRAEQTREALAETASRLQAVVNSTPDSVYIIDSAGTIVDVNEQAQKTLKYNADELIGNRLTSVIQSQEIDSEITNHITARSNVRFEGHHIRRRGSKTPVEIRVREIDHPNTEQYLVIAQDITSQKRYERTIKELNNTGMALMQSRSKEEVAEITVQTAREILTMPLTGIWFHDEEGDDDTLHPVRQSDRADDILGQQPELPATSVVAEVWREGEPRIFEGLSDSAGRYPDEAEIENEMVFPLGKHGVMVVPVTDHRLYRDEDINMAQLLATNAERALNQTEREARIRAEKRFFDTAINTVDDLFFAIDEDANLIRWNDQVTEVNGNDSDYLGSPTLDDIFQADDQKKIAHGITEGFETGGSKVKATIQTTDGSQTYEFKSARMEHPNKDETYLITIGRNITQLEEKQTALRRQNERLDKFSRVVSHDLQNPLQIASGHFSLLRDDITEDRADNADAIERSHTRMKDLINDLLTLAQQGERATDIRTLELTEVAESSWDVIQTRDATLNLPDNGEIDADRSQLLHLLENLMSNAVTHGGEDVTVTVGKLDTGFYIEDDGSGIPGNHQDEIFDTGFTTSDDGTGIGLMIVTDIADQHGWEITVTDSDAGGARFEFVEEFSN